MNPTIVVLEFLKNNNHNGFFSIADIAKKNNVCYNTAARACMSLEAIGVIKGKAQGKFNNWRRCYKYVD